MTTHRLFLLLALPVLTTGCIIPTSPPPSGGGSSYPTGGGGGGGAPPPSSSLPLEHLSPNAATSIAAGDLGYAVTGNGQGGYRVAWTDTQGTAAEFRGTIWTDGSFDST